MPSESGDPYFDNVVALFHFNEYDSAYPAHKDDSLSNIYVNSALYLTDTQKKWGPNSLDKSSTASPSNVNFSPSLYPAGTGSIANYNFLANDFTIEFWIYCLSHTTFTNRRCLVQLRYGIEGNHVSPFVASIMQGGYLVIEGESAAGTDYWIATSGDAIPLNQWVFIAFSRNSGVLRGFINGQLAILKNNSSFDSVLDGSMNFFWGQSFRYDIAFLGGAYVDDLRITKGVGRYTEDFDPPTAEFPGGNAILLRVAGTITELGVPGAYTVRMHLQSTGKLLQQTTSGLDGSYSFDTYDESPVYIIAFDESDPIRTAAIASEVIPTAV